MRRLIGLLGAGMGLLIFTAVVADAGNKGSKPPFPLNFDPDIFDESSATIDNEWSPLKPGTELTFEGSAFEDGEKVHRKVVFTATNLTKEIAGVQTRIGWHRQYKKTEWTGSTLIFLAQAKDGSVWRLGEALEHWEDRPEINATGHFDGTRAWLVGYQEGAKAGIHMPTAPKKGMPDYNQGFVPHPWDRDDWAEVHQVGQKTCVPVDCYSDVLVVREYHRVNPSDSQLKYHARGVGTVRIDSLGGEDEERATMELVKRVSLTKEQRAEVRTAVLAHETRSYMYGLTPPALAGDNGSKAPFPLNIDPSMFDETSATIDNEWWPLKPGMQWTWEGSAFDGGEKIRRKVVFTATDLTKEIAGIRTMVGWDRDFDDDEVTESELIFLAQAKDGTVWHLGESVEHFEDRPELNSKDHYDGTRVWLAGYLEGAKAGIYMTAEPKTGKPHYNQGFAPHPWDWDDWAEVYQVGQKTCVPVDCYDDVIVVREYEPAAPGVSQLKYYARGVGTIGVGYLGEEDEEKEVMELTKLVTLTKEERAEVRAALLEHERRAYMYSLTPPAQ